MISALFGRFAGQEAPPPPSAPATEPMPIREVVVPAAPSAAAGDAGKAAVDAAPRLPDGAAPVPPSGAAP
jgi:hypothetical protein